MRTMSQADLFQQRDLHQQRQFTSPPITMRANYPLMQMRQPMGVPMSALDQKWMGGNSGPEAEFNVNSGTSRGIVPRAGYQ
jgi:hypothetical protein